MNTIDYGFMATLAFVMLMLVPASIWFLRRKVWGPRIGSNRNRKLKAVK